MKKQSFRKVIIYILTWCLVLNTSLPALMAGPTGGEFKVGTGDIDYGQATNVEVHQAQSVIHWDSLDTAGGPDRESLNFFDGGNTDAAVLNRVISGLGTEFYGDLTADEGMRIFMVNPAGILFGEGSTVNVTQLVASSLNILDPDFTNGLVSGVFPFSGGATAGDVTNEGTIRAERIALIGKNVFNRGAIVATSGVSMAYAVMAAGDSVILSETGSDVAVSVEMPVGWKSGSGIGEIRNENGQGIQTVNSNTSQVILAAGDVWSAALVRASSHSGSDAVASVEIDAAGDVSIDYDVKAEAVGDVANNDNATASITIDADGDVLVGDLVMAYADNGSTNTSNVEINAGGSVELTFDGDEYVEADARSGLDNTAGVDITANDGSVIVYASSNNESGIVAYSDQAYSDSGSSTSFVNITAKDKSGEDPEKGNVRIIEESDGNAMVWVGAFGSGNINADVTINADRDVEISGSVETYALANGGLAQNNATANTTVTAANVYLNDGQMGADAYAENGSGKATANVDITTTSSDVQVINDAWIWSYAEADGGSGESNSMITIDADNVTVENFSGIYAETEAYDGSGDTSATVDIDADGNVLVKAGADGSSYITSDAYSDNAGDTTATVDIYATGDVLVNASVEDKQSYIGSEASSYDADNAKAETIVGAGGNVIVTGDGGTGRVYAWAHDGSSTNDADVTIKADGKVTAINTGKGDNDTIIRAHADYGSTNLADVKIDAGGDVELKSVEDNVRVLAIAGPEPDDDGGEWLPALLNEATVEIDAANLNVQSVNNDVEVVANASAADENIADVKITTTEDFKLEAGNQEAKIYAFAYEGIDNTANVDVDASGRVDVLITDYSGSLSWNYAQIGAEAWDGENNSANTTITAASVDVISNAYGGASIFAGAYDGVDNTAEVSVTADGTGEGDEGDITVISYSNDGVGWVEIGAYAEGAENSNSATVTLNAASDVDVEANNGGEAYIEAIASNDDESNTATITIVAGDDVDVIAGNDSEAWIYAEASYGYDNTADVDVTANKGNVTVYANDDSKAEIGALAEYAENNNTATVDVTARRETIEDVKDGHVYVTAEENGYREESQARILSEAQYAGNTNTSTLTVNADGNVKLEANAGMDSWAWVNAEADAADGLINDADVLVDAGGNVEVIAKHGGAELKADAHGGENNDAMVKILAGGNVNVDADAIWSGRSADASIWAEAENDFEDQEDEAGIISGVTNNATVDITATGDVEVKATNDGEAMILAEAYNEIDIEEDEGGVDATINGSLVNNAEVKIVTGTAGLEPVDGGVLVHSYSGGEAWIGAEAGNEIRVDDDSDGNVNMTVEGSFVNTAKVDITATGQVQVYSNGYESESWIYSEAWNDIGNETDVTETLTVNGNVKNQADTLIDAGDDTDLAGTSIEDDGDDVEVYAENGGEAYIAADASNELWDGTESQQGTPPPMTLNVTVNGSVNNIANTEVTTGDEVWVVADGRNDDEESEAGIYAWSENEIEARWEGWDDGPTLYEGTVKPTVNGSVNNQADVVINAGDNVIVDAYDDAEAYIAAWADNEIDSGSVTANVRGSVINDAAVDITTGDDVDVTAYDDGEAYIEAQAYNDLDDQSENTMDVTVDGSVSNTADVTIDAEEDVELYAYDDGEAWIWANAENDIEGDYMSVSVAGLLDNTATVLVEAVDDVLIEAYGDSEAGIYAWANNGDDNIADIQITTEDSSDGRKGFDGLLVYSEDADALIDAQAWDASNSNTATIEIDVVGGDVNVEDYGLGGDYSADITAKAVGAGQSNTADVTINATATTTTYDDDGGVYTKVNGGNVRVIAIEEGHAGILANATNAGEDEGSEEDTSSNTANVEIYTHAADVVEPEKDNGDVLVVAAFGSEATIEAITADAYSNVSDVLICADGDVGVGGVMGGDADISAEATSAYSNTASVGIAAKGDEGVVVRAEDGSTAFIKSLAQNGYTNTAETIVCTEGGVEVVYKGEYDDEEDGAGIIAQALDGYISDAYVGICAEDDVMVLAGLSPEDLEGEFNGGTGGHAEIRAEASSIGEGKDEEEPSTATANVVVVSHNGGVAVIDAAYTDDPLPRTAEITSRATGGYTNTAYTGVSAGGDLFNEVHPLYKLEVNQGIGLLVGGSGDFSHARILSETVGGYENTSDTVVCTPSDVIVMVEAESEGSIAEIGARADCGEFNTATTQVYGSEVYVMIPGSYPDPSSIWAWAGGVAGIPHVPYGEGNYHFTLTEYNGEYGNQELVWVEQDETATAALMIRDYSKRQDCPECPPCPCEEEEPITFVQQFMPFISAAPLPERLSFEISGFPALANWVAEELGIDPESIDIGVPNSLASSTDIDPYETFARLRAAAMILQDAGGEYINALAQVILEFASSTAPPTEEQMASIADAMERNTGANNQYALAGEYLDALAEYVGIVSEMGFTQEQAVQLATEKYVDNLIESDNPAVAAYVAARLADMGG